MPLLSRLLWQHPPWASSPISTYGDLLDQFWLYCCKAWHHTSVWEASGTTLGVVDAPFSDWQVTTEATGLWPPLNASINTGKT